MEKIDHLLNPTKGKGLRKRTQTHSYPIVLKVIIAKAIKMGVNLWWWLINSVSSWSNATAIRPAQTIQKKKRSQLQNHPYLSHRKGKERHSFPPSLPPSLSLSPPTPQIWPLIVSPLEKKLSPFKFPPSDIYCRFCWDVDFFVVLETSDPVLMSIDTQKDVFN